MTETVRPDLTILASGLRFPEGPVWLRDGSLAVVEIARGTLSVVEPDGAVEVVAQLAGGPNGLAVGPDGAFYITNSGGFAWRDIDGLLAPAGSAEPYRSGWIERVDPRTGRSEVLYEACGARRLSGPNDLVFDEQGGFYFTDIGKIRAHDRDHGGVYYARPDGSDIAPVVSPLLSPNGCGLSPDGRTLYVADMEPARLWAFNIVAPGQVAGPSSPLSPHGGRLMAGLPVAQGFDSLAVDAQGRICIGTVWSKPQITVVAPTGGIVAERAMPDPFPTNLCFGGHGNGTAFITLSGTGQIAATSWDVPGLPLRYEIDGVMARA